MPEPEKKEEPKQQPSQPEPTGQKDALSDERLDKILESQTILHQEIESLKEKPKSKSQGGSGVTWDQVSDRDLEHVIAHPNDYPDHSVAALQELRRRDRESIRSELTNEIGTQTFMATNKEAFDPNTPLGKEVQKIMKNNRANSEVLQDVIELAQYRIGGPKEKEKGKKEAIDAMKAAGTHAPGSETITQPSQPSFMDMPKEEFENAVQTIKMKNFK